GGAALPFKRRLFGRIVAAAVRATEGTEIPVTVKFRIGIDDAHHTHLDAGRIAAEEGAAAVALHARTAAQRYSGSADWDQIAALKAHLTGVPVLGNGDIFDADDALAMMAATGCDGVVIGRGCLGRPWLFAELSAAFTDTTPSTPPTLGEVTASCWRRISARKRACATCASTSRGTCTAFRRARTCDGHWHWSRHFQSSTCCSISSTHRCRSRRPPPARAAGRGR